MRRHILLRKPLRPTLLRATVLVAAAALAVGCASTSTAGAPASGTAVPAPTITAAPPWQLLFFGDSSEFGVPDLYAARARAALGVPIEVVDWTAGGLTIDGALSFVEAQPEKVAQAEIIVVYGSPALVSDNPAFDLSANPCVFGPSPTASVAPLTAADYAPYLAKVDQLYERIWALRQGRPTILRAVDIYNPELGQWASYGITDVCRQRQLGMTETLRAAAVAHGAMFLSVYALFNGPSYTADPADKGWIGGDGVHTSPQGMAAIADALDHLGYAATIPPTQK